MSTSNARILGAHSADYLAREISDVSTAKLEKIPILSKKFANGEIRVEIHASFHGQDIYVIATGITTDWTVNDHIMELMEIFDALKRSEVGKITLIMPHFPYLRQDKRMTREPITASLFCNMISKYIDRIITIDAHFAQFPGFFRDKRIINCYAMNLICSYLESKIELNSDYVLISPDTGGSKRIESYASRLKLDYGVMTKKRNYAIENAVESTTLHYDKDPTGKTAILVDDMIDTAGTIVSAVDTLVASGISNCILIATHGLFSGPAIDRLTGCDKITKIYITDSVPQKENKDKLSDKLEVIPLRCYIRDLIYVIESHSSVTEFLDRPQYSYF